MAFISILTLVTTGLLILQRTALGHEKLRYYETLKISDFTHRMKRSADRDPHSESHMTEVKFSTLGRNFHLYLKPSKILSAGFKAWVVDGQGESTEFKVNRGSILTGKLEGDEAATAHVGIDESGALSCSILASDDTYIIEPSWRLLPPSDNHSMVAYRRSDVHFPEADNGEHKHTVCGIKEGWGDPGPVQQEDLELHGQMFSNDSTDVPDSPADRVKRQLSPHLGVRTTCQIMVVADYTFYKNMGGNSNSGTALYLIQVIQFVDAVYRRTDFDTTGSSPMQGVGLEIGEMRIHSDPTPASKKLQGDTHYNVKTEWWDTTLLLEAFSKDRYFSKFCLAHLFTYRRFSNGVLGLAYIASDRAGTVGGLCSPDYSKKKGVTMSLNTGWSSSQNAGGDRILSLQAQLVTTHEFGHNLGSEHDPETDECAPSEYKDGRYIMYTWAVSGYDENNQVFSPCSRRYIYSVLKKKGRPCLIEGRGDGAFCGNGRIDEGEECDAGWASKNDEDRCCDSECQLRPGKVCSPMNSGCCNELCQPYHKAHVCRPAQKWACLGNVTCDGVHKDCPDVVNGLPDGEQCIDQGECRGGKCLDFCQMFDLNLKPCICAEDTGKACHRCCKSIEPPGECDSVNNTLLPDGRPCYQGLCKQGSCEKKRQDMVQRLFSIIENITIDQVVVFMKSNIVGTIMILSLIIWIPASCAVSYFDKKKDGKEKQKRDWRSRSNRTLFLEEDSTRIRRVPAPRTPRAIARINVGAERGPAPVAAFEREEPVGPSGFHWPSQPAARVRGPDDETVV